VLGCGIPVPNLQEWTTGNPVAQIASQAASPFDGYQVKFYTLDAAHFDFLHPFDSPVLAQWTDIYEQEYGEAFPDDDHRTIWENGTLRKQELVACAVIKAARPCDLTQGAGPIMQGRNRIVKATVPDYSPRASYTVGWHEGSAKTVMPVTPSGVRIDPSSLPPGARHTSGPNFETYEFTNPEAGEWQLDLYGADIPGGGEDFTVLLDIVGPPNVSPLADGGGPHTADEGERITLDASGSLDPDGSIALYEWDLDADGDYEAEGPTTQVEFGNNGVYFVGLRVTDNLGKSDTTTAEILVLPTGICGDQNNDGQVDISDAIIELQIIFGAIGPTLAQFILGDVVRDGEINGLDVILTLQHAAGVTQITECGPLPA
jgi:hypothetical protein